MASVLPDVSDVVSLDFDDQTIAPSLFDGVDTLFFMTPLIEDQVAASRRVLDAAIEGGVRHVVRLSSRSAGWDERSALRAWHREIDDAVRTSGATWTILRPCSFFQNFINYQAETIRNMSSIIVPQGDGLIPYIDALDIGEGCRGVPVASRRSRRTDIRPHRQPGLRCQGCRGRNRTCDRQARDVHQH
jgi:uncharacterized protein YbjT (DUF2867 family)